MTTPVSPAAEPVAALTQVAAATAQVTASMNITTQRAFTPATLDRALALAKDAEVELTIDGMAESIRVRLGVTPIQLVRQMLESVERFPEEVDRHELADQSLDLILALEHLRGRSVYDHVIRLHCQVFGVTRAVLKGQLSARAFEFRDHPQEHAASDSFPTPPRCMADEVLLPHILGDASSLVFDLHTQSVAVKKAAGVVPLLGGEEERLRRTFNEKGERRMSAGSFALLVGEAAMKSPVNSFASEMAAVVWDGVSRLERLLPDFLHTPDTPYHREVGPILFTAIIARGLYPGCKMDFMPVIIGPEGKGKSTLCMELAGKPHRHLSLSGGGRINARDTLDLLQGRLVVEIPELAALKDSTPEAVKAVITTGVDTHRSAYFHGIRERRRTCIFIGTTNNPHPLHEDMGLRRFYPIKVETHADLEGIRRDRPQLFAEAHRRLQEYLDGSPDRLFATTGDDYLWQLSAEAESERTVATARLVEGREVVDALEKRLHERDPMLWDGAGFLLIDLVRSLDLAYGKNNPQTRQVSRWLTDSGFIRRRCRVGEHLVDKWFPPMNAAAATPVAATADMD